MKQYKEDQLVSVGRTVDYLAENTDLVAESEMAAAQADVVTKLYNKVSGARGGTAKRTKKLTEAGQKAKALVLELLPALQGPMGRAAATLKDDDLLASVTLSGKQLRKLRPLAFLAVAGSLLGSAARADVAPLLAKRGLTKARLQPLADAVESFRTAQPAARKTIDERVLSGAALEDLVSELMDEVRELDEEMKAFKLIDRPLYDGYVQMRKIINSGGGSGKADAAVPPGA